MKRIYITFAILLNLSVAASLGSTTPGPVTEAKTTNNTQRIESESPPDAIKIPEPVLPVEISVPPPGVNTYSPGYCTWYVAKKRWVPSGLGNARTWFDRAARYGLTPTDVPAKGAIAWAGMIGGLGHVAYVEEVYEDGSFLISEMNWGGLYNTNVRKGYPGQGWRFIY